MLGIGVARGPAGGSSILVGEVPQEYELSQYNQDDSIRSCVQQKAIIRSVHLRIAHEFWASIDTEENVTVFQKEVSGPAAAEVRSSELSIDEVDELIRQSSDFLAILAQCQTILSLDLRLTSMKVEFISFTSWNSSFRKFCFSNRIKLPSIPNWLSSTRINGES